MTVTSPPGTKSPSVRGDDGGVAADGLPGQRRLRDLGGLGAGGLGGAGQGRGAGGLLGRAVDVELALDQAAGGDGEQQQEEQERGDQHQLGSRRAALPGPRAAGARAGGAGHGGHPCAVAGTNRSTGPVTVAVTANVSPGTGSTRSAVPVTVTVTSAADTLTETCGPTRTLLPIWLMTCCARCWPLAAVPPWTRAAASASSAVACAMLSALRPDGELDDQQDQQHQQRHRDDDLGAARAPVAACPAAFRPAGTGPRRPPPGPRAAGARVLIRG